MDRHRARDGPHGPGSGAELADRRERTVNQMRMRRESQIIVRRKIDDLSAVEGAGCLLAPLKDAQRAVQPLLPQGVEFGIKEGERIGTHIPTSIGGRSYLPSSSLTTSSWTSTCRIAAVGTARIGPTRPSNAEPTSNATITAVALTPTWRSITRGPSKLFSTNCCAQEYT